MVLRPELVGFSPGPRRGRRGLSLLEVLTALAIFFLSLAAITQMMDQASRYAQRAARLSRAALLADTVMAEIAAGIRPLASTGQEMLPESEPGWTCMVLTQPEGWTQLNESVGTGYGLHLVHVNVAWVNQAGIPEAEYNLTRVLLDPALRQSLTSGVPSAGSASGTTDTGGAP